MTTSYDCQSTEQLKDSETLSLYLFITVIFSTFRSVLASKSIFNITGHILNSQNHVLPCTLRNGEN